MYVQSAEQSGGHTDQKTTSTEYGWIGVVCVPI
jgi:hypothetical protein